MKIYLHIGAGKTGTSAIQAALAQNRAALAATGLLYPASLDRSDAKAARGEINSGNATALGRQLNPQARRAHHDAEAVARWLDDCLAEGAGRDILFSSESMQFGDAAEVAELVARLTRGGGTPIVICYARHLLDHAVSVYQQHAKLGLEGLAGWRRPITSMGDYIRRYRMPFDRILDPWLAVLPRENIRVRLYDRERADVAAGFLAAIDRPGLPLEAPVGVTNRSPTLAEVAMFEVLAQRPDGPALCRAVTQLLMNQPAPPSARATVAAADYARFAERNEPWRSAFDAAWFGGEGALQLQSGAIQVGPPAPPDAAAIQAAFGDAIAALAVRRGPRADRVDATERQGRGPGWRGRDPARRAARATVD